MNTLHHPIRPPPRGGRVAGVGGGGADDRRRARGCAACRVPAAPSLADAGETTSAPASEQAARLVVPRPSSGDEPPDGDRLAQAGAAGRAADSALPEVPVVDAALRARPSSRAAQPVRLRIAEADLDVEVRPAGVDEGRQHGAAGHRSPGRLVSLRGHPASAIRHHRPSPPTSTPGPRDSDRSPDSPRSPRRPDRGHRPRRRRARVPDRSRRQSTGPGCRWTSCSTAAARHGWSSSPAVARTMPATATATTSW